MYHVKKISLISLIGLFILISLCQQLPAQQAADAELLKLVPAKSLVCLRVNDLGSTLGQVDQFLTGASPIGVSMLMQARLMRAFGPTAQTTLDMAGSFALFICPLTPESEEFDPDSDIFMGILVPITNYNQLTTNNAYCTSPDSEGISELGQNGSVSAIVTNVGGYALLGDPAKYDEMVTMKADMTSAGSTGLAGVLDAGDNSAALSQPIWLFGNIRQVSSTYGPIISEGLTQIREAMSSANPQTAGMSAEYMQAIGNMYAEMLDTLLNETKSVSLVVNPRADAMNITSTVTAVPQTDMSKMFTAAPSTQLSTKQLPYLEDGAIMNYQVNMSSPLMAQLQTFSMDMIAKMSGDSLNTEEMEKIKTLSNDVIACLDGPIAYSFAVDLNNRPPFVIKYAMALKDEEKYKEVQYNALEMLESSGIFDFYKAMGLEMNFDIENNIDSYKGVSIDSAMLSFTSTETNSPQMQMISSMYGEGFDYRMAVTNGLFVCAAGANSTIEIHNLIDKAQAGSSQVGTEINKAMSLLPGAQQADFFVTLNVLRSVQMVTAIVPAFPLPQMEFDTSSNIVAIGKAADSKLVTNIALPKEHIQEIMTTVIAVQQQMMQPQTPPNRGMAPMPR